MSELILRGFTLFLEKTQIDGTIRVNGHIAGIVFFVLAILLLFLGGKIYTLVTSFILFWGVSVALCTFMKGRAGWGAVTTAFVIIGCLLAYAAYKWKKADAIILSAMAAAGAIWVFQDAEGYPKAWWILVLFAIAAGLAAVFFVQEMAIVSTITIGGFLLYETGIQYVVCYVVCGFLLQLILFERKSERGEKIWKRFFEKSSNT